MKSINKLLLFLFAIPALSCSVKFPDAKICSVAGRLQAGMDCAYTGHEETSSIDMIKMVKFLEDGALCMSSADYKLQKDAVEKACVKLGSACSFETKQAIAAVDKRLSSLRVKK